jgi:hypothetical protein
MANKRDTGYNGNPRLKKLGTIVELSSEQVMEYERCSNDPTYFIRKYCYIIHVDRGVIKFDLHDYQEELIETIHKNRFSIFMSPRQMGKTITTAGYILWYVLFNQSKSVAILANKLMISREILSRIKMMYEYLPLWMQMEILRWNEGDIELTNGSKVFCSATSGSAIRGKSISLLMIDEAAFISNKIAEDFFTSVYPTISSGKETKIIMTSTPRGYNHFWKFWNEAIEGKNAYVPFFAPYTRHPDRDEEWAKEQLMQLGEVKYNQEVLCQFAGSSTTLLSGFSIGVLTGKVSPPLYTIDNISVYHEPIEGHKYVITVDTSRGRHLDNSAFVVFDVTTEDFSVVATYKDNEISPLLYPNVVYSSAQKYNEAYVLIEINDAGGQVADILWNELEYENIFYSSKQTLKNWAKGPYPGLRTTTSVKRIGCEALKSLIDNNRLKITDQHTISELSTFIQSKSSYAADKGYKDDLVMCLVLFSWLTMQPLFQELMGSITRNDLYEERIETIKNTLPFVGYVTRSEESIKPIHGLYDGMFDDIGNGEESYQLMMEYMNSPR